MLSYMFDRHSTLSKSSDEFGWISSMESPPPQEIKNNNEVQNINNLDIKII